MKFRTPIALIVGFALAVTLSAGARNWLVTGGADDTRDANNAVAIYEHLLNDTDVFPTKGVVSANKVVVAGTSGNIKRTGREYTGGCHGMHAKVGTNSGWTVRDATNVANATLAASQTNAELIIPCFGIHVGDTITGYEVIGQIESAGNTATLDGDLMVMTSGTGDISSATVNTATMTQVSVTADQVLTSTKTGLTHVVDDDEAFFMYLKGTTAASTDIDIIGVNVTLTTL